ncbi:MAG: glycoside hydrolase N-terminal domain-containing protein [Ruminococcus sp.]
MELYYKNPAKCWLEGFPLGNGRMGAVIHGLWIMKCYS